MLVQKNISLDDAQEIIDLILKKARTDGGKPIAIAVANTAGDIIASAAMDGASSANIKFAHAKAYSAACLQIDTCKLNKLINHTKRNPEDYRSAGYTTLGGGIVITVGNNEVVGAIGISGRGEQEDHELALLGLQHF